MNGDYNETDSDPNHNKIEEETFKKDDKFEFRIASGGGIVIKLEPLNN